MYFIAILAPDNINQQVLEWKNYMLRRFNCRVALRSPAHITVIPPFHMAVDLEQLLIDVIGVIGARQDRFPVQLLDFGAFAPRVIYVHVQLNEMLQLLKDYTEERLVRAEQFPVKSDPRPFHPHMTIANRDLRKRDFVPAWEHFRDRKYQAVFEVETLSLLRLAESGWEVIADLPFRRP